MSDPAALLRTHPDDGPALTRLIFSRLTPDVDLRLSDTERDHIRQGLRQQPLASGSLVLLARAAEASGDPRAAQALLAVAQRVTRRDAAVQSIFLQQAAFAGQAGPMLSAAHALLSVHPQTRARLLPPLANALDQGDLQTALRPYVRQHAAWMPDFMTVASQSAPLEALLPFVSTHAQDFAATPYQAANAMVMSRLAAAGQARELAALQQKWLPDLPRAALAQFPPSLATLDPRLGRLGWSLGQSDIARVDLEEPGVLKLSIAPLARASVAERDMPVMPGRHYAVSMRMDQPTDAAPVRLDARILCVGKGPEALAELPVDLTRTPGRMMGRFSVPTTCHCVRFHLQAVGPDSQFEASIKIFEFKLFQI
ncbi:MAG: hypothetical protein ACKOXK_07730 [Chakrabartia sp.]